MDMFSKTLITGADGMIGSYIDFGERLSHAALDVTDARVVDKVFDEYRPSIIVHLAAATDVRRCEDDPRWAYHVNAAGTYHIARATRRIGAKMVYISTSNVFNGNKPTPYIEDDTPDPRSYYGRSKHLGELAVASLVPNHLIVRTCWVFGGGGALDTRFVGKIIAQKDASEIKAVDDKLGSPTYARDLVAALKELIRADVRGTVHVGNDGVASRFDVALALIRYIGSKARVVPVPGSAFPKDVTGANEAIASTRVRLRPWHEALAEYMHHEWNELLS